MPVTDAASKGDTDMIKLALVIGHTEQRQGAFGVSPIGENEYPWNKDLAQMMVAHLEDMDDVEAKSFFRDDVGIVGAYSAAKDYAAHNIRSNALCPGVTSTDMTLSIIDSQPDPVKARERYERGRPLGRMAAPEEIPERRYSWPATNPRS